jgi:hypothetical protein
MPFPPIPPGFSKRKLFHLRVWTSVLNVLFLCLSIWLVNLSLNKRAAQIVTRFEAAPVINAAEDSKVYFGVYSLSVQDLNFGEQAYDYDGYIWLRFRGDSLRGTIELMNSKDATTTEVDRRDSGLSHYQAFRVKGKMAANYTLLHFPFDTQVLTLEFESPRLEKRDLVFVPDSASFSGYSHGFIGVDPTLRVPDYDMMNSQIYVTDHSYPTDFGLPETGVGRSLFQRAVLEIHVQRQFIPYLTKFLFPIFLMLLVTYFVFFVPVEQLEISVVICATSLFTAIAIGLLALEGTMHVSYLMTSDRFYVLSYVMILLAFAEIIGASNIAAKDKIKAEVLDLYSRYLFFPICTAGLVVIAILEYTLP